MSVIDKYGKGRFLFKDARGDLFTKVYFKDPYENPLNSRADDITNSVEYNMMTSEHNMKKEASMKNDDIHYEFVDLIVRAALLHRKLDMSAEIGTRLNSARKAVKIYSNLIIVAHSDGAILTDGFLYNITFNDKTIVGSHFLKLIAEYLTDPVKANRNIMAMAQLYTDNMLNGNNIKKHEQDASVEYTLGEVLNIIHNVKPSADIVNKIKVSMKAGINEFITRIYSHANSRKLNIDGNDSNKTFAFYSNEANLKLIVEELENVIMGAIKSNVMQHFDQYTKLSDPIAKEFWENTFLKWNTMNKQTQTLYKKLVSLRKLDPTSELSSDGYTEVNESDFTNPLSDAQLDNYRLNLKKASNGFSNITQFEHLLPLIPSKATNLWYTDNSGTVKKFSKALSDLNPETRANALKLIYNQVYLSKPSNNPKPNDFILVKLDDTEMRVPSSLEASKELPYFHYNVDKLTRRRLYVASKSSAPSYEKPEISLSDGAQYIDLDYQNIWTRNANGKLSKKVNGDEIIYGELDDGTDKALRASSNCFTTQLKFNAEQGPKCVKYIHKCLLEDDADGLDECFEDFLKHGNFFKTVQSEVDNMHPLIALRTLQKFGFHAVMKFDEKAQIQLKKIQSVDDWLNGFMAKKFSKAEMQKVFEGNSKNENLLTYLKLVVNHVNRNPAILNKDFKGTTAEMNSPSVPPSPLKPSSLKDDLAKLSVHLKTGYGPVTGNKVHIDEKNGGIFGPFGMIYSKDYGLIPPFLVHGYAANYNIPGMKLDDLYGVPHEAPVSSLENDKYMSFQQFQQKIDSGYFIGAKFFGDLIRHHLEKLKLTGKEVIQEDVVKIQKMLDDQFRLETELIKIIKYFEEYRKLVDYLGDYDSKTISESNIVKLIDSKSKLLTKKAAGERTLVELLAAIDAIDQRSNDGSYTTINTDNA